MTHEIPFGEIHADAAAMTVPSHANYAPNNIGRRIRTNSRLFLPDGVSAKIQRSALFSGGGGLSFRQLVDDLVQI